MDSNEILDRNKSAAPADEGVVHRDNRARAIGITCMVVLVAAFIVYNFFKGIPSYSLQSVLWAYIGVEALSKYRLSKGKAFLVIGIAAVIAAAAFLANYVLATW